MIIAGYIVVGLFVLAMVARVGWVSGEQNYDAKYRPVVEEADATVARLDEDRRVLINDLHNATVLLNPERQLEYPCAECDSYPDHRQTCAWAYAKQADEWWQAHQDDR